MTPRDFALIANEAYTAAPDIGVADSASRAILRHTAVGLVVAFPGTDNIPSWIADLDIETVYVPGVGKVHKGFLDAWQAIRVPVLAAIAGHPVTFVGHSLGAALALMAAADVTVSGNPPAAVYGFEPPRVCAGPAMLDLLKAIPILLTKNGNDIVPDVPPELDHARALQDIGKAFLPIPNVNDHMLDRVIPALAVSTVSVSPAVVVAETV
jgi:triacylglycerol lipase